MRVLSLFDGISGAAQALKELGFEFQYYSSEVDKYAIQIAKENHNIFPLGNVKNISFYDGRLIFERCTNSQPLSLNSILLYEKLDLLIGGSPCQDLSIAKKDRQGLQGERSGLFYEYVRILNEAKPKYFILENVASMSKASRDIISQELGVEPVLINSALVTAQQRKRYYWVGKLVDGKYEQVKVEQPEDQKIYLKDIVESGVVDRDKSYCIDANYFKGDRIYATNAKSVTLSALGGGRGAKTGLYAVAQRGRYVEGGGTEQRFETSFNEKANSLTRVQKDSLLLETDIENYVIRKLTVNECCRLQGFPDGYCDSVSKTQGYKALGNSFTVPVIKHLIESL